jgi:DDE superfamily endonuclease
LRYKALTGLSIGQLHALALRVRSRLCAVVKPGGRPPIVGMFHSVVMVVALMRRNLVQEVAGEIFGCSQSTVSRRWDLLRPVIGEVLNDFVPDPVAVIGKNATALVDGTVCPTWDWRAVPDLFSGKCGIAGMNIQICATLNGDVAAIGTLPVHGARHDAHAFKASGLKDQIAGLHSTIGDLGYIGVDGIDIVPFKTPPKGALHPSEIEYNGELGRIRSAVEHAVAKFKTWRMLSEEGGRYRCPLSKYQGMLKAVIGLFFFSRYCNA